MLAEVRKRTETISTGKSPVIWKSAMAIGGMFGGALTMIAALILWAVSAVENINHDHLGLILIAASFVLFGIGAHGLDLSRTAEIEARKRRINL